MSDEHADDVGWAIMELMGHRRLAGYVTETTLAGKGVLRLDVHGKEPGPALVTQYYPPDSLYCLTPTTEAIARALGERLRPAPVSRYELEPPKPRDDADDQHWT